MDIGCLLEITFLRPISSLSSNDIVKIERFCLMQKDRVFINFVSGKLIISMLFIAAFSEFFLRKYIINSDIVYQSSLLYKSDKNNNTVWGDSSAMRSIYFLDKFYNFSGPSNNYQEIEKKNKKLLFKY